MVPTQGLKFRKVRPFALVAIAMMFLGSAAFADRPTEPLPGAVIFVVAVVAFVVAMIRQSRLDRPAGFQREVLRSSRWRSPLTLHRQDISIQLIYLNDLHVMGALTDDEYSAAKNLVLRPTRF